MEDTIESVELHRPVCGICGPLSALRERPLRDAENELASHRESEHETQGEDA